MNIDERMQTPDYNEALTRLTADLAKANNFQTIEEVARTFATKIYQMGRLDGGESLVFTDDHKVASLKVAETLIAFREMLIKNSFQSGLADIITREHHGFLFTKEFVEMSNATMRDVHGTDPNS